MATSETNRVSSGVAGLDDILYGGFIDERSYTIRGDSGTGKTILGYHFLRAGVEVGESFGGPLGVGKVRNPSVWREREPGFAAFLQFVPDRFPELFLVHTPPFRPCY